MDGKNSKQVEDEYDGGHDTSAEQYHRAPRHQIEDDEELPKLHGPIRRNLPLIGAMVFVILVGPSITRLLSSYHAIILDVRDDEMFIGRRDRPPEWVDSVGLPTGQMIEKLPGHWNPAAATPELKDDKLQALYSRYNDSYEGVIIKIAPPVVPGEASVATIRIDDENSREIELWAKHLAGSKVGLTLRKDVGSWDPVLDMNKEPRPVKMLEPPAKPDSPDTPPPPNP